MIDSRLTDITQRLFKETKLMNAPNALLEGDALHETISRSIALISKASEQVDSMRETVRMHEDTIDSQNSEIALLNSQKEEAFEKLLRLEDLCRREGEKAAKAEAQSKAMASRINALEMRNADIAAQLERMIQAVSESFARKLDESGAASTFRSVSLG